jgi:hypothetical protein
MLIGGYALSAYGRIRATADIDIAIAAGFADVVRLHKELAKRHFQLPSSPSERAPLFVVTDMINKVEMEVWTRPDGVVFDDELLRRRVTVGPIDDFEMYAIGPEDFIVNKLARHDRGVQDEQDVVSVLKRMSDRLDYEYLERRAADARVKALLEILVDKTRRLSN